MAYSQITLGQLSTQLGVLLDDTAELYWTQPEKYFAIQEGLRVWGAITNYWRTRGVFNLNPALAPYYDLSTYLPALRTRTWTLDQLTKEIQFECLEAANGISGAGMSGQISVTSILQAIQRARNQFVIDSRFPYAVLGPPASPSATGVVTFTQSAVYIHRAGWQDSFTGTWTNLWREDAWSIDHANPSWTVEPGSPQVYSESELTPLTLQVAPPPLNSGTMEIVGVPSLQIDLTNPNSTFNVPDEWIHAVKYAALQDIFSSESQNKDPLRAQYAEMRYQQAIDFCKSARSVIRLLFNNTPLTLDTFAAIDAALPFWRNQTGKPQIVGSLYDFLAFAPAPDQAYGISADVVQSAPIPTAAGDFIPLGYEDIPHIIDYATHYLTFKCGGQEFKDSFAQYDAFLEAASMRGGINKAKIRYLTPLFGQPNAEWQQRPDRMEKQNA